MLMCHQGYDYFICYHPSKEMALPDALSCFSPCPGPNIPLDTAIHHAHLSPEQKGAFQQAFMSNPEMHALTDIIITGWPDDIKAVPHPLHPYWQHCETLTIEDSFVPHGEDLVVPPSERERILQQLHQFHQGITKAQLLMHGCIFWPGINKAIEVVVHQCETCTQFQAQNAAAPPTPMPTLSCPWQMCTLDIFTLEGADYLICGDFYSKMILIWCLPSGQSNTVKVILLLKEMFSEHGIREVLCSDNGPQYTSAQFSDFCTSWGITHESSSPHYPQSNGFGEACVKSVKHALQCAKYSSANPQLTLLALWLMPSSHHLLSSCTNASLGPPFLPKSATLIQQPSKFMNRLWPILMPSNHRPINTVNLLHPCMLVSQLPYMTSFTRFGSLLCGYASYPRTATRYTPAMVLFTTARDDTCVNAVSNLLTLSQMPQQPHCRLSPDPRSLCHSLHPLGLHSLCHLCLLHLQFLQLQSYRQQQFLPCQPSQRHPCIYTCDTQHIPCAAQEIGSCLHST